MTNESEILSEADEIAALLPWYVSGKISSADKLRVDAFAKDHPELVRQIELAREEADTVFAANQEIHVPWAAVDKLRERLEANPTVRMQAVKSSFIDRIGALLDALTPRQLAYAGLAAAFALAVQAGALSSLLLHNQGAYQTASGPSQAHGKGTFALVAFQPAAPQSTVTTFLAGNGFAIVEGPRAGGLYRLRLSEEALDATAATAALDKLKARTDLISFASAAPASQ